MCVCVCMCVCVRAKRRNMLNPRKWTVLRMTCVYSVNG